MTKRLFLFAGEKSGDLLGSSLIKALKTHLPDYKISGVAGQEMRGQGIHCLMRTEEFEVMGFTDTLLSLPKLRIQFNRIRDHLIKTKPDAVIFIDYPGFNLRMAKALRKGGFKGKLIQYISPTVWAWGKKRADHMAETLDLLLTAYPFEPECFSHVSLDVRYVGNPIKEIVQNHTYDDNWKHLFGIKNTENLVALFPGSRRSEIQLNLPYQIKVAEKLKKENPEMIFALSCAHEEVMPSMNRILQSNSLKLHRDIFFLPKAYSYELMRDCRSAIAKSGSVTLELALHNRPTVVIYKVTPLNRFIAKYLLRLNLPHYCIVNILSGKTVFPELISKGLSVQNLYQEFKKINAETEERQTCIEDCRKLPLILREDHASEQAAKAIQELVG